MKWDVIEFDGPEPRIRIERTVDGKHIREAAKSENSNAPVEVLHRKTPARIRSGRLHSGRVQPSKHFWKHDIT